MCTAAGFKRQQQKDLSTTQTKHFIEQFASYSLYSIAGSVKWFSTYQVLDV